MTRENFTRWTCNVCRATYEAPGITQPKGWVGYGFTEPGIPAGEKNVLGHLCRSCARQVTLAMTTEDAAAVAGRDER